MNSQVALDQFAFAPFAIALFFGCTTLMEGKSIEDVKRKLNATYKDTLVANWVRWVHPLGRSELIAHTGALYSVSNSKHGGKLISFVPLQHRLLAVNAVTIPWNAFLSLKAASKVTA
ncbi:Protein required for ethanol metabolism [Ceratobasidium sp. 414]|nr:Protein required for ethanol metabolism [Ceratobasidium sp. 414]